MTIKRKRRESVRVLFPRLLQMTHRAFLLPLTEKHTQCYLICNQNEKTQADDDDFCGFFMIFQEPRMPLRGDECRTLKAESKYKSPSG